MKDRKVMCGSCNHYGVDTEMNRHIWREWDDDDIETLGYYYQCPVCGRVDEYV